MFITLDTQALANVARELLSCVWIEAVMFGCAAIAYLAVTGWTMNPRAKGKFKATSSGPTSKHAVITSGGEKRKSLEADSALSPVFAALRRCRLEETLVLLKQVPNAKRDTALEHMAPKLLSLAASASDPNKAAGLIGASIGSIDSRMLEEAVVEAHERKDSQLCAQLHQLSGLLPVSKSPLTMSTLAKSYSGNMVALRGLVDEAQVPLTKAFAKAVLQACAAVKEVDLVFDVFERADPADAAALRAFAEGVSTRVKSGDANSPLWDVSAVLNKMRTYAQTKDLKGAVVTFEALPQVPGRIGAQLTNAMIQVCIECGDWKLAKSYLMKSEGGNNSGLSMAQTTDLVKGIQALGDNGAVEQLLREFAGQGIQVSQVSYHGLLHAYAVAGNRAAAWRLVADMRGAGFLPNAVTCSILLKLVTSQLQAADLPRIIRLVDEMETDVDDVLLCSIMEACLRTGHLDLLPEITSRRPNGLTLTIPLYGSMIKAYGQAGKVERVFFLWEEMKTKNVQPTAITLGCMVEALVINKEADGAWKLVQEAWEDENQQHLVNTVTYSTLLKGFAAQPEKIMAMYDEMKARNIECNTITYNTILNQFAQGKAMRRVPQILEDMRAATPPVEPDIVTYSTLIKGFCSSGNLDRALGLLAEMQADGKFVPDEMMYNSLLDGCAKEQRLADALRLVDEMKKTGVGPSNYTLSMLVKLLGRCKRLNQVFSIVKELTCEFGFRPNIQVYTCMIQACFHNRQPAKAMALLDQILADGLRPDEKTNVVLVRGHLQMGLIETAAQLVRRSYQGDDAAGVDSQCLDEVLNKLGAGSEAATALQRDVDMGRKRQPSSSMTRYIRRENKCGFRKNETRQTAAKEQYSAKAADQCKPPWRRAPSDQWKRCQ